MVHKQHDVNASAPIGVDGPIELGPRPDNGPHRSTAIDVDHHVPVPFHSKTPNDPALDAGGGPPVDATGIVSLAIIDEELELDAATPLALEWLRQTGISADTESAVYRLHQVVEAGHFSAALAMIAELPLSNAEKMEAIRWLLKPFD